MRLVLLSLLLLPVSAYADPVSIVAGIGGFLFASQVVLQATLFIGMSVYGSAQQRKAKRRARDKYNASLQDRTISKVATEAPHVYVYGRAKVGSAIVAMFTSGDKDQYKHLVCVHAAHECEAIEEVYINGKALGVLDANGLVTSGDYYKETTESTGYLDSVLRTASAENSAQNIFKGPTFTLTRTPVSGSLTVNSGYTAESRIAHPYTISGNTVTLTDGFDGFVGVKYQYIQPNPLVRVKKHLGTSADPADASLIAEVPSKWDSSRVLRGLCYTVIRLDLNEPEFQGGNLPIDVLLKGKKLYDFRTGLTAWSDNPALAIYDYLTSEMCGVDSADLPLAQFITAANVCDEAQSFGKRYTINGTVTSEEDQTGVLERMAQCMAGSIVSTTWDIYAGKYVAPVMALSQSDIVGQFSLTPGVSDADLYNGVRGQYISSETGYVATDFKPFQNSTYVTADGREMWTNIDFPFTNSLQRVHNLCRIFTEDQRNGYTVRAEFSLKAWRLKVGDRVTLTSALFGWSSKVFRVTDKKYSPNSAVELTLKEDAASIWDFADAVVVDSTPNTNLPNPFAITPLSSLSCSSGTDVLLLAQDGTVVSRILATWPEATTQAVVTNGLIEVEWIALGSDVWQKTQVSGGETSAYLSTVKDGETYTIRARCVNPYLNVKSNWVYATHKVIGKTELPAKVDRFKLIEQPGGIRQFYWDMDSPPADLFAFEVRYSLGSTERPWDSMIPLFAKDRNARLHETTEPRGDDTYTFAICAIDTTGNASTPHYITEVLDGDAFGAVLRIVLPHETYFAGTKTDCFVSGSTLVNSGLLTWNDLDVAWGDTEATWGDSASSPIVYEEPAIDLGASATVTVRANSLVAGSSVTEMSTSTDGVSYSAWGAVPSSAVTARYFKVRWTISGTNPILYRAQVIFYT